MLISKLYHHFVYQFTNDWQLVQILKTSPAKPGHVEAAKERLSDD